MKQGAVHKSPLISKMPSRGAATAKILAQHWVRATSTVAQALSLCPEYVAQGNSRQNPRVSWGEGGVSSKHARVAVPRLLGNLVDGLNPPVLRTIH